MAAIFPDGRQHNMPQTNFPKCVIYFTDFGDLIIILYAFWDANSNFNFPTCDQNPRWRPFSKMADKFTR